jgi:hypothetical protein
MEVSDGGWKYRAATKMEARQVRLKRESREI